MPYMSKAQMRYMHSQHPDIAARWDKAYPTPGNLPEHVAKKAHGKRRRKRRSNG